MNESPERLDNSELRAEVEALRKRIEQLETAQRQNPTLRRWSFAGSFSRPLVIAGSLVLLVALLAAAGDSNALFINPQGYVGINQTKPEASLDVNGNAIIRETMGVGTSAPQSIAEIRKDARSALGPVLSISNLAGNPGAASAIDFRTYDQATPEARVQAIDDGVHSASLVFQNKVQGSKGKGGLQTNLTIAANGVVSIPGSLNVGGKTDLGIYTKTATPNTTEPFDISCNAGDLVISGGAWVNNAAVRESRPLSANTWRVACVQTLGNVKLATCGQAFAICASHVK
jgi:hypothetical protein